MLTGSEKLAAEVLPAAIEVAETAADLLRSARSDLRKVDSAEARDIKLRADRESEGLVRDRLRQLPSGPFPVIGEEMGGDATLVSQDVPYWIVDPLDGTANYQRELPFCAVSLACFVGLKPIVGVVCDIYRSETIAGGVGHPVTLNRQLVGTPNWAERPEDGIIQSGFPVGRDYRPDAVRAFLRRLERFKKVRSLGSAALASAYVALGRIDVYFEEGIQLWDIAAGVALTQAAGGVTRLVPTGQQPFQYDVWAAGSDRLIVS